MRRVGALLVAAMLVACGGTEAAPRCAADPPPSGTPNPNADPDLAATIPDEVAGEPLEIGTFCVTEVDELGGIETSPEMLDALGVERADVTVAATSPGIGTPDGTLSVGAYRFAGADEDALRSTFLRLLEEAASEIGMDADIEAATVGGKQVHRAFGAVYYAAGDTLYSVQSDNDDKVEEVLEALP
jgi:hypothetical protein